MPIKFTNEKALAPMLRPVQWTEDAAPHRRGTFAAQVLEGESQSQSAGPTLGALTANPWTVRVPASHPQNALAAYVKIGDELTLSAGVVLTVQQITTALDGHLVMRCTSEARAPME